MFLPIGDEPNPRGVPVVNYVLIAANVAVFVLIALPLMSRPLAPGDPGATEYLKFLLQRYPGADIESLAAYALRGVTAYDAFVFRWGYRPAEPSLLTLFTSMFLHGGFMHLIGNMLFLWIYGDNVESRLGHVAYPIAYLLTGAAGTLLYGAFAPGSSGNVPLVGASGAISGVLGFYFVWFPRNRVRVLIFLFPFFVDVFLISARIVLGIYLVIDNLLPWLLKRQGGGGVAYGAHIGGFLAGMAVAWVIDRLDLFRARRAAIAELDDQQALGHAEDGAQAVVEAHAAGDLDSAAGLYLTLPAADRRRVPQEIAVDLGDHLARAGHGRAALTIYGHALKDHPTGPAIDRAFLGIGLVLLHHEGRPTSAYQYLMDALDADPRPEVERAARAALDEIAHLQKLKVKPRRR